MAARAMQAEFRLQCALQQFLDVCDEAGPRSHRPADQGGCLRRSKEPLDQRIPLSRRLSKAALSSGTTVEFSLTRTDGQDQIAESHDRQRLLESWAIPPVNLAYGSSFLSLAENSLRRLAFRNFSARAKNGPHSLNAQAAMFSLNRFG